MHILHHVYINLKSVNPITQRGCMLNMKLGFRELFKSGKNKLHSISILGIKLNHLQLCSHQEGLAVSHQGKAQYPNYLTSSHEYNRVS